MNDPILAARRGMSVAHILGERVSMYAAACGGLHYLRGNKAPYFSLTLWAHRNGFPDQRQQGGAAHDTIRRLFGKKFDKLAALHLADISGEPMHAVANGAYWLAGYLGGFGQEYHGGNSKGQHGGEYREPTRAECLGIFAGLWRVTIDEAREIAADCLAHGAPRLKERLEAHAGTRRATWAREAQECRDALGLVVFGDKWEG